MRAGQEARQHRALVRVAETFTGLGDPTRIGITAVLARAELCVTDLAGLVGVSPSAVSHSLAVLRRVRLVWARRTGRVAYYTLADAAVARLLEAGFRVVQWRNRW